MVTGCTCTTGTWLLYWPQRPSSCWGDCVRKTHLGTDFPDAGWSLNMNGTIMRDTYNSKCYIPECIIIVNAKSWFTYISIQTSFWRQIEYPGSNGKLFCSGCDSGRPDRLTPQISWWRQPRGLRKDLAVRKKTSTGAWSRHPIHLFLRNFTLQNFRGASVNH